MNSKQRTYDIKPRCGPPNPQYVGKPTHHLGASTSVPQNMLKKEHGTEHHDRKGRVYPKRHESDDPHGKVHRNRVSAPQSPSPSKKAKKQERAQERRQEFKQPNVKKRPHPAEPKDERGPLNKERETAVQAAIPLAGIMHHTPLSKQNKPKTHAAKKRKTKKLKDQDPVSPASMLAALAEECENWKGVDMPTKRGNGDMPSSVFDLNTSLGGSPVDKCQVLLDERLKDAAKRAAHLIAQQMRDSCCDTPVVGYPDREPPRRKVGKEKMHAEEKEKCCPVCDVMPKEYSNLLLEPCPHSKIDKKRPCTSCASLEPLGSCEECWCAYCNRPKEWGGGPFTPWMTDELMCPSCWTGFRCQPLLPWENEMEGEGDLNKCDVLSAEYAARAVADADEELEKMRCDIPFLPELDSNNPTLFFN